MSSELNIEQIDVNGDIRETAHAYAGQALNISNPAYISAALSIWSIEARHASVAGLLLAPTPASISPNGAFDKPKTAAQVLKAVAATGFLK
ncbi:MAG: ferritin-like domain-containing protein [Solirubrobacterales bacterium]